MTHRFDLNADLGESPERLADGSDRQLMRYITSANIACGAHAGDAAVMEQTLELAREFHVAAGAHPSYPDRENFGRIAMPIPIADLAASVHDQVSGLLAIAARLNVPIVHVKPHGALYHSCNTDPEIARAVARVVLSIDRQMTMVGQAGASCLAIYRDMGLRTAAEAFADRAYEPDGTLRSRKLPGSLLEDPAAAAAQARDIVIDRSVRATNGAIIPIDAQSLCLHSDTPNSAQLAQTIRESLESNGITIAPLPTL